MNITSLSFGAFVILTLALYFILPRRRWQNTLLIVASYAFYVTWAWQFALVLLALTLLNFWLARRLARSQVHRRRWLLGAIGLNVLALAFFKYSGFFVPQALDLLQQLGVSTQVGAIQILLPVGLSYRVLELISYQVDVSRRQTPAESDLAHFALYLAYFPKLVAGPIERARSFLPRLTAPLVVNSDLVARSATLIAIGITRKILIADPLFSRIPAEVAVDPLRYPAPRLLVWLVAYAFALYNDFAGYTDIVRGVSGLFGIELSKNFAAPFFSRNFTELWTRWHITLSSWLRDYIYFPLSRALVRCDPSGTHFITLFAPPMITMLVSGLWHGPGMHTIVWGGLMGLFLFSERLLALGHPVIPPGKLPIWRQVLSGATVFALAILAAVPFQMELPAAFAYWRGLFSPSNWYNLYHLKTNLVLLFGLTLGIDWLQMHYKDEVLFLRWPVEVRSILLAVVILAVFLVTRVVPTQGFVYEGF